MKDFSQELLPKLAISFETRASQVKTCALRLVFSSCTKAWQRRAKK